MDRIRVTDDDVLRPLDLLDFANLRFDIAGAEAAIDDPESAFFRQHDRHWRARDGIHVGRHQRAPEQDVFGKAARQIDLGGVATFEHAVLRPEEEIIERASPYDLNETVNCVHLALS